MLSDFDSSYDSPYGAALQADGKIVVAGITALMQPNSSYTAIKVARYTTSGSLDQSFGSGGSVTTDFDGVPGDDDQAWAVAVQADGKVVVVGGAGRSSLMEVLRYLPDGSLDPSFGSGGKLALEASTLGARSVAIQTDNKIVVAGSVRAPNDNFDFGVARLLPSGALDPTFGTNGWATVDITPGDYPGAVLIQPDGKIIVVGYAFVFGSSIPEVALARLTPAGTPDPTFGNGGVVRASSIEANGAAALQPDGKIVVTGAIGGKFGVARFTANGAPDQTFGTGGVTATTFGGRGDWATAIAVQPDGKIVAAGGTQSSHSGFSQLAVARYETGGSLDASFGQGGKVVTTIADYWAAKSVLVQADGNVVAVGDGGRLVPSGEGGFLMNLDFALVRYLGSGSGGDTTAPTITAPAEVTTNATSPNGAVVTYQVTATDDTDANPTVVCSPQSGRLFAIGTTPVSCTATDASGNQAKAAFGVRVKGALEQLTDLRHAVYGVGPGSSLADKLTLAITYVRDQQLKPACSTLDTFTTQVTSQAGKSIPRATANQLLADASRIKTVLGC